MKADDFIIMPNHMHGIIVLEIERENDVVRFVGAGPYPRAETERYSVGAGPCACPESEKEQPTKTGQPQGVAPTQNNKYVARILSLSDVMHRFKTMTTKLYTDGVKQQDWPSYRGRLWQRNYYEHIIRDENELERICTYIAENPARWHEDPEHPSFVGAGPLVGAEQSDGRVQHVDKTGQMYEKE